MDDSHGCDWPQTIHKPRVWFCDFDDGEYSEFQTAEALRDHLSDSHPQANFSESQISSKMRWNILSIVRKPNICPLCQEDILGLNVLPSSKIHEATHKTLSGPQSRKRKRKVLFAASDDEIESDSSCAEPDGASENDPRGSADATKIARHIGNHLKSLAFLSIRYVDEAHDDEEGKSHSEQTGQAAKGILGDDEDDDEQDNYSGTLSSFESNPSDQRWSPTPGEYDSDISTTLEQPGTSTNFVPTRRELQLPCHLIEPSRNVKFEDKSEQILRLLDEKLLPTIQEESLPPSRSFPRVKSFLIWGKGGLGKTEIALEYAHTRKDKFEAIFWLDGSTIEKLRQGFRMIAEKLGLLSKEEIAGQSDKKVKKIVLNWLANPTRHNLSEQADQGIPVDWLIVFDDVIDETLPRKFCPRPGSGHHYSHGAVVITSQKPLKNPMLPGKASAIALRYKINLSHHKRIEGYDLEAYTRGLEPEELLDKDEFFQLRK